MLIVLIILLPVILVIGYQLFCLADGIFYRKYDFVKEVEIYIKKFEQEKKMKLKNEVMPELS